VTRVVTLVSTAAVALIGLIVVVAGRQIMSRVYGPSFGQFHMAASLLGVSTALGCLGLGPIMALKAMRRTRPLLESQLVMFAVSMVMVAILASLFGVNGAAAAAAGANGVFVVLVTSALRRARQTGPQRRGAHRAPRADRTQTVARHRRPA
jgi:O-antigen/teichoic acid export membrane protein